MFGHDEKISSIRLTAAQYIILAIFLILAYGLWRLQVMQSDFYAGLAEKNRIRNVPILAPRGKILDREGRIIVDNYPSFTALLLRDSSRDLSADAGLIAQGLHMNANESGNLPGCRNTSRSSSKTTLLLTNWRSLKPTAMNYQNSTQSCRIAAFIRARGSWPTWSVTSAK